MDKITIIKPKKTFSFDDIREIWEYKELLYFFVWRDFKVKYKQTVIGIAWAIIQPFTTMVIFSIFFGKLAKMPSDGVPYPIFVYTGLLFWQMFSGALGSVAGTLISNTSLLTKVYFPRLIIPLSDSLNQLVDFFFASIMLGLLMIYYGYYPHLEGILVLPLLIIITLMAAIGGGLVLASLNVKYRDVRYALPFAMQMLLFLTPVIYPASIAGKYSWILAINPMTGVIKSARGAILGTEPINWMLLSISFIAVSVLFLIGIVFFKKTEQYFADIV